MFQLPIPTFDSEHAKGSSELGQLPDWNLNDLYTSTDAQELESDLNWLEKECDKFAKDYEGKLKLLSANEMLNCVVRNEKISQVIFCALLNSFGSCHYFLDFSLSA